jgi:hypothetical protein
MTIQFNNSTDTVTATSGTGTFVGFSSSSGPTYFAENTSSGVSSKEFIGIPSTAKTVVIVLANINFNTTFAYAQIGNGSFVGAGYSSTGQVIYSGSGATTNSTSGFIIYTAAAYYASGTITLTRTSTSTNTWSCDYNFTYGTTGVSEGGGYITLGGALDRVRITGGSMSGTAGCYYV